MTELSDAMKDITQRITRSLIRKTKWDTSYALANISLPPATCMKVYAIWLANIPLALHAGPPKPGMCERCGEAPIDVINRFCLVCSDELGME